MYKIKSKHDENITFRVMQKPLTVNGEYYYPLIEGSKSLIDDTKRVLRASNIKFRTQKVNPNFMSLYINTGNDNFWHMNGYLTDITLKNHCLNKFLNRILKNMDVSYKEKGKDTELYEKIQKSLGKLYFK